MKTRKWNLIFLSVVVAIAAGLFATVSIGSKESTLLSDADLGSFWGGVKLCGCETSSKCKCSTNDCDDIECSPCQKYDDELNKWVDGYCMGEEDDPSDVTHCYKTTNASDSCSQTELGATNCDAKFYTSSGCDSSYISGDMYSDCDL